jgi:hypothetical protein
MGLIKRTANSMKNAGKNLGKRGRKRDRVRGGLKRLKKPKRRRY